MKTESGALAERFYSYEEVFPFLAVFKQEIAILVDEAKQVISSGWMPWPEKHLYEAEGQQWDIFPFLGFGRVVEANCRRCPRTYELLQGTEGLKVATYSRLGPKTTLHPHYGPGNISNGVLRSHLGLIVPDQCGIWVEKETRTQEFGEWLVFDDSKEHSGFNDSDEERIVLLLDIDRPAWVPQGVNTVERTMDAAGLPDNWGVPDDFI